MIEQSNKDGASAFSLCVSHLPNQILRYWALYSSSFVIIDQAIKISPASLWFAHMLTSHNFISLSEFGTWAVPLLLVCPQLSCSNLQQVHRSEALRLKRELASLQALLASYRFFLSKAGGQLKFWSHSLIGMGVCQILNSWQVPSWWCIPCPGWDRKLWRTIAWWSASFVGGGLKNSALHGCLFYRSHM